MDLGLIKIVKGDFGALSCWMRVLVWGPRFVCLRRPMWFAGLVSSLGVLRLREDRKRGKFGLVGKGRAKNLGRLWGSRGVWLIWVENAGVF